MAKMETVPELICLGVRFSHRPLNVLVGGLDGWGVTMARRGLAVKPLSIDRVVSRRTCSTAASKHMKGAVLRAPDPNNKMSNATIERGTWVEILWRIISPLAVV